jgi:hypothetical protein
MTIKQIPSKPFIDTTGPDGNSFVLIWHARSFAKQLGFPKETIESITTDMMSDSYEHLLEVFEEHFGEYVDLLVR